MAKAIIAAAKELAEAAVAKAKADSVADIDEEAIDNFMILKGTVLNLEYSSCITNKGH